MKERNYKTIKKYYCKLSHYIVVELKIKKIVIETNQQRWSSFLFAAAVLCLMLSRAFKCFYATWISRAC